MYFRVNEFEEDVNDYTFSGNEQRKVYKVFSFFTAKYSFNG